MERDYTGGELIQFAAIYPLELEGRVRFLLSICHVIFKFELLEWTDDTNSVSGVHQCDQRAAHFRPQFEAYVFGQYACCVHAAVIEAGEDSTF